MKHLKRILAVVVPLVVAACSTIAVSPAAQHFVSQHPGLTAYLLLAAGVLRAVYKAFTDTTSASAAGDVPGPGSSTMSAK